MTIGELAEHAAVSTRTLRFWANEGLIPCDRTATGYRSFGPDALPVAGLIRLLREVDVDLATIRSILAGRTELAGVVSAHVGAIEARIAQLRFHRSVLRAVATINEPTTQEIMHDLANLTADQRRQIITDLVAETFAGVDPRSAQAAEVVERIGPVGDRAALADQLERFTDARVDRYWALLGAINGWPEWPSQVPAFGWFVAALRA